MLLHITLPLLTQPSQRLLDHLKEAAFYSQKDLDSIAKTLLSMRETVERGKGAYALDLVLHLDSRLSSCERILKQLQDDLAVISPELVSTHETLVSILRSTAAANTRSKVCQYYMSRLPH